MGNIFRDTEEEITGSVREAAGNRVWMEQLLTLGTLSGCGAQAPGEAAQYPQLRQRGSGSGSGLGLGAGMGWREWRDGKTDWCPDLTPDLQNQNFRSVTEHCARRPPGYGEVHPCLRNTTCIQPELFSKEDTEALINIVSFPQLEISF